VIDKSAILRELEELEPIPKPAQPGDVTIGDVMSEFGISRDAAKRWLIKLVGQGKLQKLEAVSPETGRRILVYRKKVEEET